MSTQSAGHEQAVHVAFAVLIGVALIGFFVGTGDDGGAGGPLVGADAPSTTEAAAVAPTYRGLRTAPWSDGAGWSSDVAALRGPGALDPVELTGTDKATDLAERAARRAYDGAPPTIPHAVRQQSAAECLACHDEGLRLRGALATPVSHETFTSCTQCHVVSQQPMPGAALPPDATFAGNGFDGLDSPTAGARASGIAPPVIPHQTTMRERCMSCHGPNGRDALRSTHPERQNCEQCHASSAERDLRPGTEGFVPWAGGQ